MDVIDPRPGFQYTVPAGQLGAPGQVLIFQIGKEVLVEAADFIQHLARVEGRAAAGSKDFDWSTLFRLVKLAAPPIPGNARPVDGNARGVDAGRFVGKEKFGRHHSQPGAGLGSVPKIFQPAGFGEGVVVEQGNPFALRGADALIAGRGKTRIFCIG